MLYNEKRAQTVGAVYAQRIDSRSNPASLYSIRKQESIYSLKIEKIRHFRRVVACKRICIQ